MSLAGQTVLITAATQGIGRASVMALLRAGAKGQATDISYELLANLAGEKGVITHHLDVLKWAIRSLATRSNRLISCLTAPESFIAEQSISSEDLN